jgi:glucose-1-phosphate thymidylyltransferase
MDLRGVLVVEDATNGRSAQTGRVPATEHVANRPIAHHVLDALASAGVRNVVVASSARSAGAVRECLAPREGSALEFEFVESPAPLELSSALTLAAPLVAADPCIVHVAGGLLTEPLGPMAQALNEGADAVVTVHRSPAPDQHLSQMTRRMLDIEDVDAPAGSALGVAGVWGFGPGALRHAATGPRAEPEPPTEMARRIAAQNGRICARLARAWRSYRGEAAELLELNQIVLDAVIGDLGRSVDDGNQIEGRVSIDATASVRNSVLVGPIVVGPGVHIRDAYIGPYTSIGAGACIEGAEVERSIIGSGATLTHVGTRVTASVVGRNARVFRDFSLPRALRLNVGEGNEVGLC